MRGRISHFILFFSLLKNVFSIINESTTFGVDDWKTSDIANFLKTECWITIPVSKLEKLGINPESLFEEFETLDELLGVEDEIEKQNLKEALETLRYQLNYEPKDLFEWRLANRRLFGWLQIMMAGSPRMLLLYLRFVNHEKKVILDRYDDCVDEIPIHRFVLQWLFVPQLPFYDAIKDLDYKTSYLETIKFMIMFRLVLNVIEVVVLIYSLNFLSFLIGNVVYEMINLLAASMYYYVFWFLMPPIMNDWLFFFSIFVLIPMFTFVSMTGVYSMMESVRERKQRGQMFRVTRIERSHVD